MIEPGSPGDWRDLENAVARILRESGLDADTDQEIRLARGTAAVDVLARDQSTTPPSTYICECKHWQRAISKDTVHGFRTVVGDSGANRGFLISSGGFQSGAREAADFSNVALVTWLQFQDLFVTRWFQTFMAPTLIQEGGALHEYTEPINSRIERRASGLSPEQQQHFRRLQETYAAPSFILLTLWYRPFSRGKPPALPLRGSVNGDVAETLPSQILDVTALRSLMNEASKFYGQATTEFDEVFGGRA